MGMSWRCSLVLNLKWSLQLLFLWAHTTIKAVLPLNRRRHIKGQGLVFLVLKILDFVPPAAQCVPMQEDLTVSLLVFTPPLRSQMRHLHCFTRVPHLQLCREILVPKSQYPFIMSTAFLWRGKLERQMLLLSMNLPLNHFPSLLCGEWFDSY